MIVENVPVSSRLIDSLGFSQSGTAAQAQALKDTGCDGFIGYLGCMNAARLSYILDAGLGFMPVTLAGEYEDGAADEIAQLTALGIPKGVTVWLDVEGLKAFYDDPVKLMAKLRAWAVPINAAGWFAGAYIGAPQPLTSEEWYQLPFVRYWWGLGKPVDRFNHLVYPGEGQHIAGWCMIQQYHGEKNGMLWKGAGVLVDTNGVQCDNKRRLPTWMRRGS